jgi:hypothetical protein
MILQFSILVGQPIVMSFSKINPSAKKESHKAPPAFLITEMSSKSPEF